MNKAIRKNTVALLVLALTASLGSAPVLAEKPEWAGKGHGKKHDDDRGGKHGRRDDDRREVRVGGYFSQHDRDVARGYYGERYREGKGCPPGLAKKNNGCLPPGQAKKYAVGQPLPAGVVYYPVPQPVLVQLPPPPSGHKYVRVAADILLIAVGTSMVVDAITDLGRL
jgi:Ni/Co efflux regulator RcnB